MGDLFSAGLDLIGSVLTNQANTDIANSANTAAQQRQDAANAYNAQQYATRYQTTVKDMEAAGLNPMLAYTQGGGSPIPASAAPVQLAAPRVNALANATHAYRAASANAAAIKLQDAQVDATNAQTEVARTQALSNIANEAKLNQDKETSAAAADVSRQMLGKIAQDISTGKAQQNMYSATAAETFARTKNELAQDPWYVNYLKKFGQSAQRAWEEKIKQSNKYLYNGNQVQVKGQ